MANYTLTVEYDDENGYGLDWLEEAIDQAGGFVTKTEKD